MRWMTKWVRGLSYLLRRDREERELDDEMRFHVEMEARDLVERGVPPEQARRRARVAFGGVDRNRERVRDARGVAWLDDLRQDLAFAVHTLARSPAFTSSVLVVLALAIGATTAVFGVVDAVLLRSLPYPEPDRLVRVWMAAPARDTERASLSVPDAWDLAERSNALTHLTIFTRLLGDAVLTGEGPSEEIPTAWVAGDFFGVMGVPAALGRTIRPDEQAEGHRVVVFSHDYWQRRFGGDPELVGRTLTLDQAPFQVVGILPPGFAFPDPDVDAWIPLTTVDQGSVPWERRYVRFLQAAGRMAPGVTPERARDELASIATALSEEHADTNEALTSATVASLRDVLVGDVRRSLHVVLGAVGMILLIACANVAGLLLARGDGRTAEIAVRMSMGAGRVRVVRQLLTEAFVLGGAGGLAGLAVAWSATRFVVAAGGDILPRATEVGLDARVLAFAAGLTLATTVLFGLLPALRATDAGHAGTLREKGRGGSGGPRGARLRRALVAAEVAVALVLLVGAGLLLRSLDALTGVDPGFETEGVAAMTFTISEKYPTRADFMGFYREVLDRVAALPSVRSVGTLRSLPTRGFMEDLPFTVPGVFEPSPEDTPSVQMTQVGGEVFRTLGIEVLTGRTFDARDVPDGPGAVVVNETLVERYFGGVDPVGRTLGPSSGSPEIIGVVEDVLHGDLTAEPEPTVYVHQEQNPRIAVAVLARVEAGVQPESLLTDLRNVVTSLDQDQPVTELTTLEAAVHDSLVRPRFLTVLLGSFAALAAFLSALGLYGVIAFTVRQRRPELGLRMALGADAGDVVRLVVRQGMATAAVGLAAGLVGAVLLTDLMQTLLYRVEPLDPPAFLAASLLLTAMAFVACVVPAARASRLRPMEALRCE